MRRLIQLTHGGITYSITVTAPAILSIRRTYEDSGMVNEVKFDHLPKVVKEKILTEIKEEEYE